MSADSPDPEEFTDSGALQDVLRAEHTAVYGYGFVGAHCEGELRERCHRHLDAHRERRDTVRGALVRRNESPVGSEGAYELPSSTEEEDLKAFAVQLEERTAHGYLRLAAGQDASLRDLAARSLQETTVRALSWGADLSRLPGFPEGDLTELGSD